MFKNGYDYWRFFIKDYFNCNDDENDFLKEEDIDKITDNFMKNDYIWQCIDEMVENEIVYYLKNKGEK